MSKKDEEIQKLVNEAETLKARIANLEEENKQLRLRSRGLDKRLRTVIADDEQKLKAKENDVDRLKDRIITIGKQAEKVLDAKNKEIENLSSMVKERAFAIKSSQPMEIRSHTVIHGAILSDDSITLGDNVLVDGHIDSGGAVNIGAQSTIKGVIRAKKDVDIGLESEVQGDIESGGDVSLDAQTKVGSVKSQGSVDMGEKCSSNKVYARGDVIIGNGAQVALGIKYGGSVSIGKHTAIKGTIEYIEDAVDEEPEGDDHLFEEAIEEEQEIQEEEVKKPMVTCPICGNRIAAGSKRCGGCGTLVKGITGEVADKASGDAKVPHTVEKRRVRKKV
ncbi:MAG: hypothetical protein QCI38_07795 [Candidatus Thermoplasmatota archaeon]|nr:hypothetical protein [Candidatus Thermoplasmatota archaeon]